MKWPSSILKAKPRLVTIIRSVLSWIQKWWEVSSYYFDTRKPGSKIVKFDEFPLKANHQYNSVMERLI
jgi:hypothetical protein